MRHLDLFSGIGGFALAAQSVWGPEYENVGFCDNEPFAQAILHKHWPQAKIYDDIKELRTTPTADIVTGGFPCQPFSAAGKRRGTEDDRHLWPEMLRVIQLATPRWVIGENVGGLLTWDGGMVLDTVLTDLESAGYEAWPFVLPAAAVGAPHRRDRVWIIAHTKGTGDRGGSKEVSGADEQTQWQKRPQKRNAESIEHNSIRNGTHAAGKRLQRLGDEADAPGPQPNDQQPDGRGRGGAPSDAKNSRSKRRGGRHNGDTAGSERQVQTTRPDTPLHQDATDSHARGLRRHQRKGFAQAPAPRSSWEANWIEVATRLCRVDDGLPRGVDRAKRLRALGNAIVPQVAVEIMRAIKEIDQ